MKYSGVRACILNERVSDFTTPTSRALGAAQNALGVGERGREVVIPTQNGLGTCPGAGL
jgi:hypothetical protein